MASDPTCEFAKCTDAGTELRTVANKKGSAFSVPVCVIHARFLDGGGTMLVEHTVVRHDPVPAA